MESALEKAVKSYLELYLVAFRLLCDVYERKKGSPRELIESARIEGLRLSAKERGFVRFVVYGTLRRDLSLEYELSAHLRSRKKMNPKLLTLLKMGLFLVRESVAEDPLVVDLILRVADGANLSWGKGVANSVLRKLSGSAVPLPSKDEAPLDYLEARYSFPKWLGKRVIEERGIADAEKLAEYFSGTPTIIARVNRLRGNAKKAARLLKEEGVEAKPGEILPDDALILPSDVNFGVLKCFKKGFISIQDEASQAVGHILNPRAGERILDLCAAPGTKTTQIYELSEGGAEIVAADINNKRLLMLKSDIRRLKMERGIRIIPFDGLSLLRDKGFDAVLLDAPCSGIGTWRRNPDGRIFRREDDIAEFVATQRGLISKAAQFVKPGGRLLYSVCTITAEETVKQREWFLEKNPQFESLKPSRLPDRVARLVNNYGEFITFPPRDNIDGFYATVFRRKAKAD